MFNLFKKSEYEEISQKIKYKNHKITEKLNKTELNKFSKLSEKKQKEYLKKKIGEYWCGRFFFTSIWLYFWF